MARFTVYRLADESGLVLDCQADTLDHFRTRVVVPLKAPADIPSPLKRLHPSFDVNGATYVMATHLMSAVMVRSLGEPVAWLRDEQDAVAAALDMLLVGY